MTTSTTDAMDSVLFRLHAVLKALTAPGATTKSAEGAESRNVILPPKDFARVYSAIHAAKDVLRGYSKIDYDTPRALLDQFEIRRK